ncbi:FadR/GntR family transcriptional regulator [Lentisphaera marina]|uniref:FadR/GntR family transcriptional regulator n=1 Tax=Lentisphaera marina TaxID=1111041 RepID=UPI002366B017|nr:FadR/GntR family transcriptional regulator [Lentisphaera marina]MDD7986385.1 FadR/GntR family transcriptional regulator [Lentisphaera marina]
MFKAVSGKEKLSVQVAKELEKSILDKRFLPDQPIPSEARLCESFKVSRTVVREAIQQLKSQGIIHSIPGSGNYISRNDTSNLQRSLSLLASLNLDTPLYSEIIQLRELLEVDCIKTVCQTSNEDLVQTLESHVENMRTKFDSLEEFGRIDHAFHLSIIKASGNNLFYTILESLYHAFVEISMKVYDSQEMLETLCNEHAAITEAIKNQDADLASRLLLKHIHLSKVNI